MPGFSKSCMTGDLPVTPMHIVGLTGKKLYWLLYGSGACCFTKVELRVARPRSGVKMLRRPAAEEPGAADYSSFIHALIFSLVFMHALSTGLKSGCRFAFAMLTDQLINGLTTLKGY
jgi:hypothetical protein